MNGDPTLMKRLMIGSLGALSPILANLLVVDLNLILANATPLTSISYVIRILALCATACIVVYLNSDETKPIKIFQLGIAAPALLTGIINGVSLSQNVQQQAAFNLPAIISSANAQPARVTATTNLQPKNCLKQHSTASQQILKGLFSILPDNRWFVVVSSNLKLESAIGDVRDIERKFSGRFHAAICEPVSGDGRYRVVIGENMTRDAAQKLQQEAVSAGLPNGTWLWSPLQAGQ